MTSDIMERGETMEDPEKGRWLNMAEMSSLRGLWDESGAQSRVWVFRSLRSLIN